MQHLAGDGLVDQVVFRQQHALALRPAPIPADSAFDYWTAVMPEAASTSLQKAQDVHIPT